ncbi:MAG: Kiwa anti-phage protein KwaB-like domain-containing protein [bacterium]
MLSIKLDDNNCELTVCLASIINNQIEYERLQLSDNLIAEFKGSIKQLLKKYAKQLDNCDLVIHKHDVGTKLNGYDIEYFNLSDCKFIQNQITTLFPINKKTVFNNNELFISYLKFYVISIKLNEEVINFFRIYNSKKELSRSNIFAALFSKGQYNKINVPVFLFDYNIDCISKDDAMFIINKANFYNMFRYHDLIKQYANETLSIIKELNLIHNFDKLQTACDNHLQMQLKLYSISKKQYLRNLTINEIKEVINTCSLKIEISKDNDIEMIVFNPSNKWEILRLLDDGYLQSLLTKLYYETDNKRLLN